MSGSWWAGLAPPSRAITWSFVTSYKNGIIPERLQAVVKKDRALAHVIAITPDVMEQKMTFVNADEMKKQLQNTGKIALYGIQFDSGQDVLKPESHPTIAEMTKVLNMDPSLRLHVVGHTDNRGKSDYTSTSAEGAPPLSFACSRPKELLPTASIRLGVVCMRRLRRMQRRKAARRTGVSS
jgi:hypothetical protein